jgi:hypothetical protein
MNTIKDYNSKTNLVKDKKCFLLVESHSILNNWKNDTTATECALPTLAFRMPRMWLSEQILACHRILGAGTKIF